MRNCPPEISGFRENSNEFLDKSPPIEKAVPVYQTRTALKIANHTRESTEKSPACHPDYVLAGVAQ